MEGNYDLNTSPDNAILKTICSKFRFFQLSPLRLIRIHKWTDFGVVSEIDNQPVPDPLRRFVNPETRPTLR